MKVLKALGTVVGFYVVARVLIAIFVPSSNGILGALTNIMLVGSMILAVLSLLSGGRSRSLKSLSRCIGLILGLTIFTIVVALLTSENGDGGFNIAKTFVEKVVPFGNIIGTAMGVIKKSAQAEPFSIIKIAKDFAKLLLEAVLNPILSGFLYVFLFENQKDSWESSSGYAKRTYEDFTKPEPSYNKLRRTFSLRGIIAEFYGAIIAIYAATFVFNWGVKTISAAIGEIPVLIILGCLIVGLFLLAWLSPILRSDLRPHSGLVISKSRGVLSKLVFSLLKMITINILVILIVGLFVGSAS